MDEVKKEDDQIKWSKKDIWLIGFVLFTMSLPVLIARCFGNLGSWILDFVLIVLSVKAADKVFKNHYEKKRNHVIMSAALVFVMMICYVAYLYGFKKELDLLEVPSLILNYTIRMLSIFMLSYSFYYDNIKKGKICDNLKKLKSKMK